MYPCPAQQLKKEDIKTWNSKVCNKMLQPIPKPKLKIMNLTNHATENYSGTRV
jgi:hypothetical protein